MNKIPAYLNLVFELCKLQLLPILVFQPALLPYSTKSWHSNYDFLIPFVLSSLLCLLRDSIQSESLQRSPEHYCSSSKASGADGKPLLSVSYISGCHPPTFDLQAANELLADLMQALRTNF